MQWTNVLMNKINIEEYKNYPCSEKLAEHICKKDTKRLWVRCNITKGEILFAVIKNKETLMLTKNFGLAVGLYNSLELE